MRMITQTPLIEQTTGFAFDSNDFAMHFSSTHSLLVQPHTTSMEEWSDDDEGEKEDEETIVEIEIDPDLEDGDEDEVAAEEDEDSVGNDDDDDEFEQYLFGEDDE
jgi:hypothetical protein